MSWLSFLSGVALGTFVMFLYGLWWIHKVTAPDTNELEHNARSKNDKPVQRIIPQAEAQQDG